MAGPIRFVCTKPEHQTAPVMYASPLTIHEQRWAYCPSGVVGDHAWEPTEATTVDALRRAARVHEVHA